MTRKYIGGIGVTLGLALSIAGCSPTPSSTREEVTAGKSNCYWNKTSVASDTRLVCATTVQILKIDTSGVGDSTKSGP